MSLTVLELTFLGKNNKKNLKKYFKIYFLRKYEDESGILGQ